MSAKNQEIWSKEFQASQSSIKRPRLVGQKKCDVVVIGAGLTGLLIADRLAEKGLEVIVVERNKILSGTTPKTSAHLSTLWDYGFQKVYDDHGKKTALALAEAMRMGLRLISKKAREMSERVEFEFCDGYMYEEIGSDSRLDLKREFSVCKELGFDVSTLNHNLLPFEISDGFVIRDQGKFHPVAFAEELISTFPLNVKIFEDSAVTRIESQKVILEHGEVQARYIVEATHTPIGMNLTQSGLHPMESFLVAGTAGMQIPDALLWDNEEPYHYIRKVKHQGEELLLIGGADKRTGTGQEEKGFKELEEYISSRGLIDQIKLKWSAQFFEPVDGLPFIGSGHDPFHLIATGFSGNGLTLGAASALIMSEIILGQSEKWNKHFSPQRNFFTNREFLHHNYEAMKGFFRDRWSESEEEVIDRLSVGEGEVIGSLIRPKAVYKDHGGEIKVMSALCPHMGGVVQWNSDRKSFDCSCHGSRFDCNGRVLEGPSTRDLKVLTDEHHHQTQPGEVNHGSRKQKEIHV